MPLEVMLSLGPPVVYGAVETVVHVTLHLSMILRHQLRMVGQIAANTATAVTVNSLVTLR